MKKAYIEIYEILGGIVEIDNQFPAVIIHKNIDGYKKENDPTLFFDSDQVDNLVELIQILEKGLKVIQKETKQEG